mmetsp:Transcript_19973/g.32932  ORF Transcript_19973/g.32932 Transcript_19973/m.32932 type:complete len:247 (+) Transcript_19973:174-914(+)
MGGKSSKVSDVPIRRAALGVVEIKDGKDLRTHTIEAVRIRRSLSSNSASGEEIIDSIMSDRGRDQGTYVPTRTRSLPRSDDAFSESNKEAEKQRQAIMQRLTKADETYKSVKTEYARLVDTLNNYIEILGRGDMQPDAIKLLKENSDFVKHQIAEYTNVVGISIKKQARLEEELVKINTSLICDSCRKREGYSPADESVDQTRSATTLKTHALLQETPAANSFSLEQRPKRNIKQRRKSAADVVFF